MPMDGTAGKVVMVTGACGNLGRKAVGALARAPWCAKIVAIYPPDGAPAIPDDAGEKHVGISADLTRAEGAWEDAMAGVDAIIHFAARNPVPESDWSDAAASFDMTVNLGLSALRHGASRFVFCSSNHVMGRYKDAPLASRIGPGLLTETLPIAAGTVWTDGNRFIDATPYSTSKVMGERFCQRLAEQSGGKMTSVSIRLGWALPGDNDPADVSTSGSPNEMASAKIAMDAETGKTLRWFRDMWLSNDDFDRLVVASLTARSGHWPTPGIVVNGTSANRETVWSLAAAARLIGYSPQDDVFAVIRNEL